MNDPLDKIEGDQGMRDMASLTRSYFLGLREAGFDTAEAITLTAAWVRGVVSGGKA